MNGPKKHNGQKAPDAAVSLYLGDSHDKRKWRHVQAFVCEIHAQREAGRACQEMADRFGLDKVQAKN